MDKKIYRVRNWKEYNQSLVKRGSITFWIEEACLRQSKAEPRWGERGRGRPEEYSDGLIESCLTLKALFRLTLRATEGFMGSLLKLLRVKMASPGYSLLCRRQKTVSPELPGRLRQAGEKVHLALDTTGLKVYGEGEWKVRQHGTVKHRLWRKLHLAVNTQTHQLEAFELTELGTQDCEGVPLLMEKIAGPVATVRGDGAYDRFSCYGEAQRGKFDLISPPQRNARLSTERKKKNKAHPEAVRERDRQIEKVRELGLAEWKIQSGYHRRSLAETAMFRVKTLLGNRLASRTLENQKAEAAIWCRIINKMTALGMPSSVVVS